LMSVIENTAHYDMVKLLLKKGADAGIICEDGTTAMILAEEGHDLEATPLSKYYYKRVIKLLQRY
jgi:hypothetical protein